MRGYLPFNSQVRKNGDQSMKGTSFSSGKFSITRGPVNDGLSIRTLAQSVWKPMLERIVVRHQLDLLPLIVRFDELLLSFLIALHQIVAPLGVQQLFDHAGGARGVEHVDGRLLCIAARF